MKSDLQLQQGVMDELLWDPSLESAEVGVSVNDGVVTISCTVRSWSERNEVEKAAWATPGVTDVKDELIIAP